MPAVTLVMGIHVHTQARSMVTHIQLTPLIMKFVPGESVAETDTAKAFYNLEEARRLSLATQIHNIEGVIKVLFGPDFINVTKVFHLLSTIDELYS